MATTRVWNVTDKSKERGVTAQTLLLFGKVVPPGRFVEVEESDLVNAHKVLKEQAMGLVYIGKNLPPAYAAAKMPPRAALSANVARSHMPSPKDSNQSSGTEVPILQSPPVKTKMKLRAKLNKK